ncbi:MAG TPA: hypothetical protein VLV86_02635, partial [Vicinamibacterales bacterium]|nr:hypothetical protein [Vicinamibacterales bacterium]
MPAADRHIPSLDGLRGLSIGLVVLAHLSGVRGAPNFLSSRAFDHGQLGVKIFFVVSWFLITRLIADEIGNAGRLSFPATYATNYVLDGRWETGHLWSLAIEE